MVLRPWADPRFRVVAAEVAAAHEADLRVEVLLDDVTVERQPVTIGVVMKVRAVSDIVAGEGLRARARDIARQVDALEQRQVDVDTANLVAPRTNSRDRPARVNAADVAAPQDIAPNA